MEPEVTEPGLFEAIATQRTMRRLRPDPVPEGHIRKLIWAATRAPNGGNVQPWRFLVVTDGPTKLEMARLYRVEWAKYRLAMAGLPVNYRTDADRLSAERSYAAGDYLAEHMEEVPVLIVVCGFLLPINSGIASGSSIYPAIQNLMLAARGLGLGTAMTTLHRQNEDGLRELLGIPANAHVGAVIPVGWPVGRFGSGPRLPVEAVTYWDRWGNKRE
jgi:nitroreductase